MAIVAGLTTLANLREYLRIPAADTGSDTFLENIVTRISKEISKRCNRVFAAADVTEYQKGNGKATLMVRQPPINSIASIHIDLDRVFGSDTQIAAADIIISADIPGAIILNGDIFDKSDDVENVKIVYNGGYTATPADLEHLCIKLCAYDYLESGRLNNDVKGEQDYDKMRDDAWKQIINNYKLR